MWPSWIVNKLSALKDGYVYLYKTLNHSSRRTKIGRILYFNLFITITGKLNTNFDNMISFGIDSSGQEKLTLGKENIVTVALSPPKNCSGQVKLAKTLSGQVKSWARFWPNPPLWTRNLAKPSKNPKNYKLFWQILLVLLPGTYLFSYNF